RNGFDMQTFVLSVGQFGDAQFRSTYPAIYTTQGGGSTEDRLNFLATPTIPSATSRWQGTNRATWVNAGSDARWPASTRAPARPERNQQLVQMLKIVSEELPAIPYYFNFAPTARLASLKGPEMGARVPDPRIYWNIYEWTLTQ